MTPRVQDDRPAGTAGFTLPETLVALSLVALLMAGVLQAVRWVGTATLFGQKADRAAQVEAGATALTTLLASALPAAPAGPGFVGDEASFSFDGVSDGTALPPGRVRISIGHQRNATGGALVATVRPAPGGVIADGAPAWTSVLIEGVPAARISYFGRPGGRGTAAWSGRWPQQATAPGLVWLDLTLDGLPTLGRLPLYARVGRGALSAAPIAGD